MAKQHSRRQFLAASAALPLALRALTQPQALGEAPKSDSHWVLVGTGTEKGIFRASFDPATGALGEFEVAVESSHPTYLALHPTRPFLYAANELPKGDGQLSCFELDRNTASLTPLSQISSQGNGPCCVSVDRTGQVGFAANYGGGSVVVVNLVSDGEFDNLSLFSCNTNLDCGTPGPVKARQDGPHMHCVALSPENRYVLACDLGDDAIEVMPFVTAKPQHPVGGEAPKPSRQSGALQGGTGQRFATRAGSGPRHLAFHPNGRWVYCIFELDCTIEAFDWSLRKGGGNLQARPGTVISTLAAGAAADSGGAHPNTACEIVISPDGKYLYANTRGANTLAVYEINRGNSMLTEQQRVSTGGDMTRHFAFDHTGHWLLCANQGSSTITVFSHEPSTGRLGETPKSYAIDTPMFVQFL